jgi:hypothetical protein
MKLPLTWKRENYYAVIKDGDGEIISDSIKEIEEDQLIALVAYANAYHKVKQVVDAYRSSSPHVSQEGFVADVTGRLQDVLNIVDQLDTK